MKAIVYCITNEATNQFGHCETLDGIGSIMNGIAFCHQIALVNNLEFKILCRNKKIKKFINIGEFELKNEEIDASNIIHMPGDLLIDLLRQNKNNFDVAFVSTKGMKLNYNFLKETKKLIDKIFRKNETVLELFDKIKANKNIQNVLHIRTGDYICLTEEKMEKYFPPSIYPFRPDKWFNLMDENTRLNLISQYIPKTIKRIGFVCSDNSKIKYNLNKKFKNLGYIKQHSMHSGVSDAQDDDILLPLVEFNIMSNANELYSIYSNPYGKKMSSMFFWSSIFKPLKAINYFLDCQENSIEKDMGCLQEGFLTQEDLSI